MGGEAGRWEEGKASQVEAVARKVSDGRTKASMSVS